MVRALVQPLEGTPASPGAGLARSTISGSPAARPSPARSGVLRPGFGLLIGTGVSVGLWAGLAKLALALLR
jgi:hypothetical protein